MARFGLFGDSYIKRLDKFFNGDIRVPGESIFVHQGGLRLDRLTDTMKHKMKAAETYIIFLSIGGNDISPNSVPEEIFDRICALVTEFEDAGVRQVFISEILPRADFSKSNPPGLTKSKFDRDRKRVNKLLSEKYGKNLVKFNDIHCPRDYDKDLVHLSYPTEASTTCGQKMDDLSRIPVSHCPKVFVQRDYTNGTTLSFQNKFPAELEGKVDVATFQETISTLNRMYLEAETLNGKTYCESCLACLTAYMTYICFDTYYEKMLKKIRHYIDNQNRDVYVPRGLMLIDPVERGLRVLEICLLGESTGGR